MGIIKKISAGVLAVMVSANFYLPFEISDTAIMASSGNYSQTKQTTLTSSSDSISDSFITSDLTKTSIANYITDLSIKTLSGQTTTAYHLTWSSYTGASSYQIYRAVDSNKSSDYKLIATQTTSPYDDYDISSGHIYYYYVTVLFSDTQQDNTSNIVSSFSLSSAPSISISQPDSSTSATLIWDSIAGTTSYQIYRNTTGTFTDADKFATTQSTTYVDKSLSLGITYYYAVASITNNFEGKRSGTVSITTGLTTPEISSITATSSGISLAWSQISGSSYYRIYRSTSTDENSFEKIAEIKSCSYTDIDIHTGTTYYYKISAISSNDYESKKSATRSATYALSAPSSLTATLSGSNSVYLSWNAVDGATEYRVYRCSSNSSFSQYTFLAAIQSSTYFTDSNIPSGVTYYYRITAVCDDYESSPSDAASASTTVSQPTNLCVSSLSTNKVVLSWSVTTKSKQYNIYRSTSENGQYTKIGSSTTTSYTDSTVSNGTTYYYYVVSYDGSNYESGHSNILEVTMSLNIPTSFKATLLSNSNVKLTWDKISGASSYNIYRSTSSSSGFSKIANVTTASYVDSNLAKNVTYYYYITSVNGSSESSKSSIVSSSTSITVPTNVTSTTVNNKVIRISWTAVSGACKYNVYRSTSKTGTYNILGSTTCTYFNDSSISYGKNYYYKVSAVNGSFETALSSFTYKRLDEPQYTVSYPKPTGLSASVTSSTTIQLKWKISSGSPYYYIYRSTSTSSGYTCIATSSTTSYTDSSIIPGTYYYYYVVPTNRIGYTGPSSDIVGIQATLPVPTSVAITLNNSSYATLTWNTVTGATQYGIYRSTTSESGYTRIATVSGTTYTDSTTSLGVRYYYKLTAINSAFESGFSNFVTASTAIEAPSNVSAVSISNQSISISWDTVSNADSYEIYQSVYSNRGFEIIATTSTNKYLASDLDNKTTYYYKVSAISGTASSSLSSITSAKTSLKKPTSVKATAGKNKVTVSWSSVTDADKYLVYRSTKKGSGYTLIKTTTSTKFTDKSRKSGTTYYYKVKAANDSAKSSYSSIAKAKAK